VNWSRNNSDGPFTVPPTGDLDLEWGVPGAGAQGGGVPFFGGFGGGYAKHRFFGGFLTQAYRDVSLQINVNGHLGTNYGEQTGLDDNGDLIFNDRPAGIGRNTLVTPAVVNANLFASYSFTFGPSIQLPPGIQFGPGAGGGVSVTSITRPEQGRYRMTLNLFVYNITNRTNFSGYTGVHTSPLFGKPTSSQMARRIHVGMNLQF